MVNIENYGNMLLKEDKFKEASAYYKKAIALDKRYDKRKSSPTRVKLLDNYAVLLGKEGRYAEAKKLYLQALRILPNKKVTHYNLACLLSLQGSSCPIS
jgi:tetratricopeptide (TPR) repeat protein